MRYNNILSKEFRCVDIVVVLFPFEIVYVVALLCLGMLFCYTKFCNKIFSLAAVVSLKNVIR